MKKWINEKNPLLFIKGAAVLEHYIRILRDSHSIKSWLGDFELSCLKCYWNVYWLIDYFLWFGSPYGMDSNGTKFKLVREANLIL